MSIVAERIAEHKEVLEATKILAGAIEEAGILVRDALASGHKLLICGNGILRLKLSGVLKKSVCRFPLWP